jgi:hypothetical protein
MLIPDTPYTAQLEGRDPLVSMRETIPAYARLVEGWSAADFERRWAEGKWTARQVLVHLAQTELALGTRARMALTTPDFAAQPFDQDRWLPLESFNTGPDAARAFVAIATFNLALYTSLTDAQRQTSFSHSQYGRITVDWIIYQEAGHQVHHLKQLRGL